MIITFFGHSNYIYNVDDEITLMELFENIIQNKKVNFYFGGYGNFDNFALKCAKKYKEKHNNCQLIFITPYINSWLDNRKDYINKNFDGIIYPEIETVPLKFAISKRNEWMIDKADYLFAYVNCHFGGAYKALLYANRNKKPYTNLYSDNYELY